MNKEIIQKNVELEIGKATMTDIPALRKLWKKTFEDEEWYLDLFFENIFLPENTLVARCEGIVISMLYMIPYMFRQNSKLYDIMYLYALATDEKFRGRGIMSELIKQSEEFIESKGYIGSILIPAEETLFSYYEKQGFNQRIKQEDKYEEEDVDIYRTVMECIEKFELEIENGKKEIENKINNKIKFATGEKDYEIIRALYNYSVENGIVLSKEQNLVNCETFVKEGGKIYLVYGKMDRRCHWRNGLLVKNDDETKVCGCVFIQGKEGVRGADGDKYDSTNTVDNNIVGIYKSCKKNYIGIDGEEVWISEVLQ